MADASNEGWAVHGSSIGLAPNTCFWQDTERMSEHAMAVALALHEHSYGWKSEWLTTLALASVPSGPLFSQRRSVVGDRHFESF